MTDAQRPLVWLIPSMLAAAALPSLLAYNTAPSATFLNQALALFLWGLVVAAAGLELRLDLRQQQQLARCMAAPLLPVLVLLLAAAAAWLWRGLPASLALSNIGILLAAGLLVVAGCFNGCASHRSAAQVFALFCLAWLVSGLLNALLAGVQILAPQWADGQWLARTSFPGRAAGNLRQPNHVSTLLLWAIIAALALHEMKHLRHWLLTVSLVLLTCGLVLTASRTGVVGVVLLALWGILDRRLTRPARGWLTCMPLLYGVAWYALKVWSRSSQASFGAESRLAEADLSGTRFTIWSNTWDLIQRHPLAGVGFGEFNKAWTLTPMANRAPAFFDHTHNLLLQWAVELGLPLALLLTALMCRLLFSMWQASRAPTATAQAHLPSRVCLVFLLMIALHSQLEYPLWYAYFLLPTAWLLGFGWACTHQRDTGPSGARADAPARHSAVLMGAGVLLALASVLAVADYRRVAVIFDSASTRPLAERIAAGQRSIFFAHHADYAAATVSAQPEREQAAFSRASHYLLDTRLMTSWADAFAAAGDLPRAVHLAARLREFRHPVSADEFFAVCASDRPVTPALPEAAKPYPCRSEPTTPTLRWTDFGQPP